MNRALPIEKLRGIVFSAPLPTQFYQFTEQIGRTAFTRMQRRIMKIYFFHSIIYNFSIIYSFMFCYLDMMETYRAAIERRVAAEEELQEQVSAQNTPEMVAKVNECKEAERQLKSIEERLGMLQ